MLDRFDMETTWEMGKYQSWCFKVIAIRYLLRDYLAKIMMAKGNILEIVLLWFEMFDSGSNLSDDSKENSESYH